MKIVQTTKEPFSICKANQWTGFYMITASVMKELKLDVNQCKIFHIFLTYFRPIFGHFCALLQHHSCKVYREHRNETRD